MNNPVILPKVKLASLRKLILVVFLFLSIFSLGYFLGSRKNNKILSDFPKVILRRELPDDKKTLDFSLFWRVWDDLSKNYFNKEKIVPSNLVYGAIKGMVEAVGDPYTVFLTPGENKIASEDLSGSFEGIGVQIGFKGTQLVVIAALDESPAQKAGIKAGDFIVGIKDEQKKIDKGTFGMSLPEAVEAIRGPSGSKVTLAIVRDGIKETEIIEVVRSQIKVESVSLNYLEESKNFAHIKLLKFGKETESEWQKIANQVAGNKNIKGIILDLRNNPGGYLQGAVDVSTEFVKSQSLIVVEERANGAKEEFKTQRVGKLTNIPVVVLVNKGSASASEILAGALRDLRGVKLIGETTFGKGTIQEPQEIEGGSGLHITIAKWLTPKGVWIDEKGLEPDVKIEDDPDSEIDEQLQKAIEQLKTEI